MKIEPRWWRKEDGGARCELCPHRCFIASGKSGLCGARRFDESGFSSPWLGRFSSCAVDPVEKKPFYHWRPGSYIFSLGSVGCNMRCPFCQNHRIAHPAGGPEQVAVAELSPESLVEKVLEAGLRAVAWTYNEPALQAEYILRAASLLKPAGIAAALVTNGMFSAPVLEELAPCVDAANVDVKTFNFSKYAALGGSLDVVRANIEFLSQRGVHVELTHLVVPEISDSPAEFARMVDWIAGVSPEIPLHVSRCFPAWKYAGPPTDLRMIGDFVALAQKKLKHVHPGNVW